jgi:hypothetical protein
MKKYLLMMIAFLMVSFSLVSAYSSAGVIPYTYDPSGKLIVLIRTTYDKDYSDFVGADFGGPIGVNESESTAAARRFNRLSFYYIARLFEKKFYNEKSLSYFDIYDVSEKGKKTRRYANYIVEKGLKILNTYFDNKMHVYGKLVGTQRLYFFYIPSECFFTENAINKQMEDLTYHLSSNVLSTKKAYFSWIYPFKLKEQDGKFLAEHAILGKVSFSNKYIRLRKGFFNVLKNPLFHELVGHLPAKEKLFKENFSKKLVEVKPVISNAQPVISNTKNEQLFLKIEQLTVPAKEIDEIKILDDLINNAKKSALEALAEGNFVKVGEYTQKLYNFRQLREFVLQNVNKK